MFGCGVEAGWLLFVDGEAWDEARLLGGLWGAYF